MAKAMENKTLKITIIGLIALVIIGNFNSIIATTSESISTTENNTEKFAVLLADTNDESDWYRILTKFTYNMLTEDYGFTPDNIFLICSTHPLVEDEELEEMIDYPLHKSNVELVFSSLAEIIDNNDILFVWGFLHGQGYFGNPDHEYYGFSALKPKFDPEERDYLESEFKFRSLYTHPENHGMNVWKQRTGDKRYKYVSTFENIYIKDIGEECSNNDIWIEKLVDYKDSNGDWGDIDSYEDNIDASYPFTGKLFDPDKDNCNVCIDLNYDSGTPKIDGCDTDNEGLFDWMDINEDGDKNDWVGIDETICTSPTMTDDEMRQYMSCLPSQVTTIICLGSCHGGGFIQDLSASNRIICTACTQETSAYGGRFIEGFTSALHGTHENGNSANADYNTDGKISITEAFNYAVEHDTCYPILEKPQYDDNGDGISHTYQIPNGGDGSLGSNTFLGDKNQPPNQPAKPSGSTNIKPGKDYNYSTFSLDPNGDNVEYFFDWGDNNDSGWIPESSANHTWTSNGDYNIKVKARDEHTAESIWSEPLQIKVEKSKTVFPIIKNIIEKFLEQYPHMFPILQALLQQSGL